MADQDDLEPRVSALEETVQDLTGRVRRSEQDAAAARVLAGGADRDVAEIRGEMREFRGEVRTEFADVRNEMRSGFTAVRTEMRDEFAAVRTEMRDEFAAVRTEMRDGLAAGRTEMSDESAAVRTEMSEYRDHNNRVLNAMRADMTDLREHVDRGFMEMRGRLDAAAAGQQQIVDLLGTLIARDDRPDG